MYTLQSTEKRSNPQIKNEMIKDDPLKIENIQENMKVEKQLTKNPKYDCKICKRNFINEEAFESHCNIIHKNMNNDSSVQKLYEPKEFKCEYCGKLFLEKWKYAEHVDKHNMKKIKNVKEYVHERLKKYKVMEEYKCKVCKYVEFSFLSQDQTFKIIIKRFPKNLNRKAFLWQFVSVVLIQKFQI